MLVLAALARIVDGAHVAVRVVDARVDHVALIRGRRRRGLTATDRRQLRVCGRERHGGDRRREWNGTLRIHEFLLLPRSEAANAALRAGRSDRA
jgi:hypothetical protein